MLPNLLYLSGAFAMAWLISGIFLLTLHLSISSPFRRLLVANCLSLIPCEVLYRTIDVRFFFPAGALIYAMGQGLCLASQCLLLVSVRNRH
jgi:hypothetical protein